LLREDGLSFFRRFDVMAITRWSICDSQNGAPQNPADHSRI
jgi:hypothetical protein